MIKRINISLAVLLCLGGQYEHILCTSAAPTTNNLCLSEDDLDYDTCNIEDLSNTALSEICKHARDINIVIGNDPTSRSQRLRVTDLSGRTIYPHNDYVSDAEHCLHIKEMVHFHLLKMTPEYQLQSDGISYNAHKSALDHLVDETLASNDLVEDVRTYVDLIRMSNTLRFDPWEYIGELVYQTMDDSQFCHISPSDGLQEMIRNRKVIHFLVSTFMENDEEVKEIREKNLHKVMAGAVKSTSVWSYVAVIPSLAIVLFLLYVVMLMSKFNNDNDKQMVLKKQSSSKKKKRKKKN